MCPLWPAHYLLLYVMIFVPMWMVSFQLVGTVAETVSSWEAKFDPESVMELLIDDTSVVNVTFTDTQKTQNGEIIDVIYSIEHPEIAKIFPERATVNTSDTESVNSFNITGSFLGTSKICALVSQSENQTSRALTAGCMTLSVIRKAGAIDKAFTYSVAALVAIIYINMGAALDTRIVKDTIKRPIGPAIGFFSQFVIMPLLSFVVAKLLLPTKAALQLGLFITGCSPGGGASNIWTLTLGGNLDLSITMTTISTFSAFAMMPLWILTLGSTIFEEANLTIPYTKIVTFAVSLIVPLIVGIIINKTLPKVGKFLVRILKPFAVFLIIFIIVFAIYTNLYLFKLFTWRILLAGLLVPWLGYLLGGGTALLLKQSWRDTIAIAIETGVQNTGLAIFALRFSLPQPEADITTALPVAVAIMTPIVPTVILLIQKFTGYCKVPPPDEIKEIYYDGNGAGPQHAGGRLLL